MANLKKSFFIFFALFLLAFYPCASPSYVSAAQEAPGAIKVTILYDNYVHTQGTKADWGFACLVEGTEKTILFDTGTKPDVLWHNIDTLNVDISQVDQVVLSHEHGDHTRGLFSVLEKKPSIPVYVPISFTDGFVQKTEAAGGKIVRVDEPVELCKDVYLTGEMKGRANEISLILDTSKGLVVITGCAHPGIVDIVRKAKEIQDKNAHLVFGGFHLLDKSETEIEEIIHQFEELGVAKCGATHCTGDKAIAMFKKAYGDNYVGMGVGKIVKITK